MAATTITGPINQVNNEPFANKWIKFTLGQLGTDATAGVTVAQSSDSVQTDASGDFTIDIWDNGESGVESILEVKIEGSRPQYVIIPKGTASIELWDLIENYQAIDATPQVPVISELFLAKSANLSDLPDVAAARTNLGLGSEVQSSKVIVNQSNVATTLGGTIDSTKEYLIDGVIDMTGVTVTVPPTGLQIRGYSFAISKLTCADDNYTMFTDAALDSGSLLIDGISISVTGANSKVYHLANDGTGFFVTQNVMYSNCTNLGSLTQFAQGVESNVEKSQGSPSLELGGTWGGFRGGNILARNLAGTMTAPLYKAGGLLSFVSRFILDINVDLPSLAPLCDFTGSNFASPSLFQIQNSIITRDGGFNSSDTNITQISASDLACSWRNNEGIDNTFVGCELEVTAEAATSISDTVSLFDVAGTWTLSNAQHFDQSAGGDNEVEHLGNDPREFLVNYDFVVEGTANDVITIAFIRFDGSTFTVVSSQTRVINSLIGSRDVGFFNRAFAVTLDKNDILYAQVRNETAARNVTVENSSYFLVTER
jgi:hypothetical protein